MRALDRKLVRDLWHLRGPMLAASLVVACGVASFVAMLGTYHSLLEAQARFYREYRFADVFARLKRAPEPLAARIREIAGVSDLETRVVREVTLDVPGLGEPATGRLVSLPEGRAPRLNALYLRAGRMPERGQPDEVLASEAFAVANGLRVGDTMGAVINGRWRRLSIAGVALSPEYVYEVGGGLFPDNRRFGVLWMGREALGTAFDMDEAFNDLVLRLGPGASEPETIARIDALLAAWGGLGAHGRADQTSHRFLSDEISQNRITATWVPAIFLGVAAFLLHMVLTRLVAMQRMEIGVLKAFGYGDREIALHYLKLALAGVAGGTLLGTGTGLWLGSAMMDLYRDYYRFPSLAFAADAGLVAMAVAVTAIAAAAGAWSAVGRAAALPPAEAMRPEPPASFRAGWLEAAGLHRLLPASARMVLRNIARRPVKAVLSVVGIALASGILLVGGFFFDAIDHLMRVQFEVIQREDVTVLFNSPRSAGARHDLARLPGVTRVEPFRSVPVRLRFEHRSRRLELSGVRPGGELRRLLDERLRPVELPPDGIVLSGNLARALGVAAGDAVTVEVLEGERPVRQLQVTGFVDTLAGMGAWMDFDALGRMLGEEGALSGAYLSVDPAQAPRLYADLKRVPAVAGVAIREAMLESFRRILAQSLMISTIANMVFACVIAFGMVYNGARIALSERGHELASLRVLGFTRAEIGAVLLGEQGLLTILGIPLGLALGYGTCAFLAARLDTELYRIPLVVETGTFLQASLVVMVAAVLSGLLVARRLGRLDLVAVLKTRE